MSLELVLTGAKFCIKCGESFKRRCPKCGLANPADAKFCQECGTSFGSAAEPKKSIIKMLSALRQDLRMISYRDTLVAKFALEQFDSNALTYLQRERCQSSSKCS